MSDFVEICRKIDELSDNVDALKQVVDNIEGITTANQGLLAIFRGSGSSTSPSGSPFQRTVSSAVETGLDLILPGALSVFAEDIASSLTDTVFGLARLVSGSENLESDLTKAQQANSEIRAMGRRLGPGVQPEILEAATAEQRRVLRQSLSGALDPARKSIIDSIGAGRFLANQDLNNVARFLQVRKSVSDDLIPEFLRERSDELIGLIATLSDESIDSLIEKLKLLGVETENLFSEISRNANLLLAPFGRVGQQPILKLQNAFDQSTLTEIQRQEAEERLRRRADLQIIEDNRQFFEEARSTPSSPAPKPIVFDPEDAKKGATTREPGIRDEVEVGGSSCECIAQSAERLCDLVGQVSAFSSSMDRLAHAIDRIRVPEPTLPESGANLDQDTNQVQSEQDGSPEGRPGTSFDASIDFESQIGNREAIEDRILIEREIQRVISDRIFLQERISNLMTIIKELARDQNLEFEKQKERISEIIQESSILEKLLSDVLQQPLRTAASDIKEIFRQTFQSVLRDGESGFDGLEDRILRVFETLGENIRNRFVDLLSDIATDFVDRVLIGPIFDEIIGALNPSASRGSARRSSQSGTLSIPSIPGISTIADSAPVVRSATIGAFPGRIVSRGGIGGFLDSTAFSVPARVPIPQSQAVLNPTGAGFTGTFGAQPGGSVASGTTVAGTAPISFGSILGGTGLGFTAGTFLPALGIGNAGIGNTLGSGGGALIGSIAGSFTPLGPIGGGLAGGLLGGGLGGLFGGEVDPGPPQSFAKGVLGAIEGLTDNGGDASVAVRALNEVLTEAASIAESLGVEFRQTADAFLQIDQESGQAVARIGDAMGRFGSAAEATDFLLEELVGRIVKDLDPAFQKVIDVIGDIETAIEAINFIRDVEALPKTVAEIEDLTENLPPLEQELRGIQARFDELASEAERLGLATGALAEQFGVAEQIEAARRAQLTFAIREETDALVEQITSQFEDLSDFNDSPLEREIRGLAGQFDQLAESARELGLAEAELMRIEEARQASFTRIFDNVLFGVEQQILNFQSPVRAQIQGFKDEANRVADQLRAAGEAAGISPEEIEAQVERVRLLKRLRIDEAKSQAVGQLESQLRAANDNVRQFFEGLIDPLDSLRQDLITSDLSALSPGEQLSEVRAEFSKIAAAAAAGELEAIEDLPRIAQQRLQVERLNFATGPAFGEAFREVNAALLATQSEIEQERDSLFADFGISITEELKDQTATLREELQGIRRELRNVRDQLEAA